jgi:hypothetical protein
MAPSISASRGRNLRACDESSSEALGSLRFANAFAGLHPGTTPQIQFAAIFPRMT